MCKLRIRGKKYDFFFFPPILAAVYCDISHFALALIWVTKRAVQAFHCYYSMERSKGPCSPSV